MCIIDDDTVLEVITISNHEIEFKDENLNFTPNNSRPMGFDEFNAFIDQAQKEISQEI